MQTRALNEFCVKILFGFLLREWYFHGVCLSHALRRGLLSFSKIVSKGRCKTPGTFRCFFLWLDTFLFPRWSESYEHRALGSFYSFSVETPPLQTMSLSICKNTSPTLIWDVFDFVFSPSFQDFSTFGSWRMWHDEQSLPSIAHTCTHFELIFNWVSGTRII